MLIAYIETRWLSVLTVLALAFSSAFLSFEPAKAATIRIEPVKVEILAAGKAGSVKLTNEGSTPAVFRVYGQSWAQVNGRNIYADTESLITSPALTTIAVGKSQLVRVGLRKGGTPGFYRLMIEEVPEAAPGGGVKMALRFDLPLFILQEGASDLKAMTWSVTKSADGVTNVSATNNGTRYVRLNPEQVSKHTGLQVPTNLAFGTVLPGSTMTWQLGKLPMAAKTQPAQMNDSKSDAGPDALRP